MYYITIGLIIIVSLLLISTGLKYLNGNDTSNEFFIILLLIFAISVTAKFGI